MTYDDSHPESERLMAFASGHLGGHESAAIEDHLNVCECCCAQLQQMSADDELASEIKGAVNAKRLSDEIGIFAQVPFPKNSQQIGPYKLLQRIGIGGMGEVWMAEQLEPVRRRVAIKLTHAGGRTKEVIARFEAERQALSMMDHPNIAKVLDAGSTESGIPYFVMELVKGIPLLKFCDDRRLDIRERLALFVSVCKAVHHAHQKGIIHRDLKPSNVLVALYDGEPIPKVIDFGLAKALDTSTRLTEKTIFTEFGKIVGTLNYMSPEQAEMNALDVDTRSDVYSLGVILYELLTGSTPVEEDTIRNSAFLKVLEIIREAEPPSPSKRVTASRSAEAVSAARSVEIQALERELNGELDWVVMKALEKNRDRRYDSASNFAADITRFLNDDPVLARPASTGYYLKRFVRKNRRLVASAAILVGTLVTAVIVSSFFAYKANLSAEEANRSAKRSDEVLRVVTNSFHTAKPIAGPKTEMLAKDVLRNARESVQASNLDFPGRMKLMNSLAASFRGIGDYQSAIAVWQELYQDCEQELGPDHPATLQKMNNLAVGYAQLGRLGDAVELLETALPKMVSVHGSDHQETLGAQQNLASFYNMTGQPARAVELQQRTLQTMRKKFGIQNLATLQMMNNLGSSLTENGQGHEAQPILTETVDMMAELYGEKNSNTISVRGSLAICLRSLGKKKESVELLSEVVNSLGQVLGQDHPETVRLTRILATMHKQDGQLETALQLENKILDSYTKNLGANHGLTSEIRDSIELLKQEVQSKTKSAIQE